MSASCYCSCASAQPFDLHSAYRDLRGVAYNATRDPLGDDAGIAEELLGDIISAGCPGAIPPPDHPQFRELIYCLAGVVRDAPAGEEWDFLLSRVDLGRRAALYDAVYGAGFVLLAASDRVRDALIPRDDLAARIAIIDRAERAGYCSVAPRPVAAVRFSPSVCEEYDDTAGDKSSDDDCNDGGFPF